MQRCVTKLFLALAKICVFSLALTAARPAPLRAQVLPRAPTPPAPAAPAANATDPLELGRETPRGTVVGFI